MDLGTQRDLNVYFGMRKAIDWEQFRWGLVQSPVRQHHLILALNDSADSIKRKEVSVTGLDKGTYKLAVRTNT